MRTFSSLRATLCAITLLVCLSAVVSVDAQAASVKSAPGWEVTPTLYPSALQPGHQGYILLTIYNVGRGPSSGAITVTDKLPQGVTATEAGYVNEPFGTANGLEVSPQWECSVGSVVTCTNIEPDLPSVPPGENEFLAIAVNVSNEASGTETNQITVTGGGASLPAGTTSPISIGSSSSSTYGFQDFDAWFSSPNGEVDTQAGSHPYTLTVAFGLDNDGEVPAGEARSVSVDLPRGLIGNPTALPRCTAAQLNATACPADSQVGTDRVILDGANALRFAEGERPSIESFGKSFVEGRQFPVYNMVPPPGVPAQLGFSLLGLGARINAGVRSADDYEISANVENIPQLNITFNSITVWGVPGDPTHTYQRELGGEFNRPSQIGEAPFLTLPTACEGPQPFKVTTEPWAENGIQGPLQEMSFATHDDAGVEVGLTGCSHLNFNPSISVAPDTSDAETPSGLTVELKTPQEGLTAVEGLASSNIKDTTVTLPEGMAINPGQAHGLQTCSEAQSAVGTEGEPSCPNASRVGTDEIETPLLFHNLKGNVYVLDSNPPNLKLLVAASGEGVNLKLVGDVHLDEATGRLTTTFKEAPELPFTTFKLSFSGGAQAALYTPARCDSYTTNSDFTPWSTPSVSDAFPSSQFVVSSGPNGSSCQWPEQFAPSLTAGSTTDQAGGYTSFSLLLTRPDGQQRISTLQFKTPEGLLGMISKVPLCQEPQAAQGDCPAASRIGHTTVEAGPGPYPLVIPEPGQAPAPIYLTVGYKGAPYGLSIAVPVIAGPFNLGTVVVRASIAVDPKTSQLTITTDPLPSILDGVPTDLRVINAVVDRPGFMFNPTDCSPQSFSGTATSTEGAQAGISSPFQVGSCQSLKFAPDFKVSTSGKTSKADGASFDAKILYPTGTPGANQASSQANVASVKVDLPKQLPSRLTTLQKACLAKVFEANPANCPAASVVGHATAITPVLPVPVAGPAYFVSHGGEAFPSLIVVLQGYGVTVELVGTTFISKAGITSSTFKQVPDVPITSFDLSLPEGKYSALAANGNLCTSKLAMPTAFVGQNGAVIHQSTPISVTGCPKAKSLTRAQKLAKALKACKKKAKGKRTVCEQQARKQYAPVKKKAKKK
jgi:hypothetical protein